MNKSNQQNTANNAERSTDQMQKSETHRNAPTFTNTERSQNTQSPTQNAAHPNAEKSGMKDQAKPVIAKNAAHAPTQAATKSNAASMSKEKQS